MIEGAGLSIKAAIETVGPCVFGGLLLLAVIVGVVTVVASAVSVHDR